MALYSHHHRHLFHSRRQQHHARRRRSGTRFTIKIPWPSSLPPSPFLLLLLLLFLLLLVLCYINPRHSATLFVTVAARSDAHQRPPLRYIERVKHSRIELITTGLARAHLAHMVNPNTVVDPVSHHQEQHHTNQRLTTISHTDSFRLSLTAFGTDIHFILEPAHDLIHPNAIVHSRDPLTGLRTQHPFPRHEARVYKGRVVRAEMSDEWTRYHEYGVTQILDKRGTPHSVLGLFKRPTWAIRDLLSAAEHCDGTEAVVGQARMFLHSHGPRDYGHGESRAVWRDPVVSGSFTVCGERYTLTKAQHYEALRREEDARVPMEGLGDSENWQDLYMVVHKESDRWRDRAETRRHPPGPDRSTRAASCQAHLLPANLGSDPLAARATIANDDMASFTPSLQKRQDLIESLTPGSGTSLCPSDPAVLYMGVASDCTYHERLGSAEQVLARILSNWNQVSHLYQTSFNVGLGIVSLEQRATCGFEDWNRPCDATTFPMESRLSAFSRWRGDRGSKEGLWHLMTACSSGKTVGMAWMNTLCNTFAWEQHEPTGVQTVSGTGVSSGDVDEWKVVAHEIGHNFGAYHDCTDDTCECRETDPECACCPCTEEGNQDHDICTCENRYVMSPTSNFERAAFSPCTVRDICGSISLSAASCLQPPGAYLLLERNECGNGIKEPGEECDCGQDCGSDPCCREDCQYAEGAMCSDRHDECCDRCAVREAGHMCRKARGECDVEERCDGVQAICPLDEVVKNGAPCSDGNGGKREREQERKYCASGTCTNRDQQCRTVGDKLGMTGACSDFPAECGLYCRSLDPNVCTPISGTFLDGTDCGYGGMCLRGLCQLPGFREQVWVWVQRNGVVAGIAAGVAVGLVMWICQGALKLCCRRRRRRREGKEELARNGQPCDWEPSAESTESTSGTESSISVPNSSLVMARDTLVPKPPANTLSKASLQRQAEQSCPSFLSRIRSQHTTNSLPTPSTPNQNHSQRLSQEPLLLNMHRLSTSSSSS